MDDLKTLTIDATGEKLEIVKDYLSNMMTDHRIEPLRILCVRPTPIPPKEKSLEEFVIEAFKDICSGAENIEVEHRLYAMGRAICEVIDTRLKAIEEKIK